MVTAPQTPTTADPVTDPATPVAQTTPANSLPTDLTDDQRLDLFDQALTDAEQSASVLDQAVPGAVLASDPLNPPMAAGSSSKKPESVVGAVSQVEVGSQAQVEYEPSSELPVEVEGFLERVEDHADKLPQEIVIAGDSVQQVSQSHPTQTVVVLPITEEEAENKVKDPKLSLAWLLEWSHKIIKKFVGKVVYRHEPQS